MPSFSNQDLAHLLYALILFLSVAHIGGQLFQGLKLPRVIGEILGGLFLGPSFLGLFFPDLYHFLFVTAPPANYALSAICELGLLLLMFCSGMESQMMLSQGKERNTIYSLSFFGLLIPFIVSFFLFDMINTPLLHGLHYNEMALKLIFSIAMAVTSIPIISRILMDLNLIHTPMARIILSTAIIEDLFLYGALSVALSYVTPTSHSTLFHTLATLSLFLFAMTVGTRFFRQLLQSPYNPLTKGGPSAFIVITLFTFTVLAISWGVATMFGAFIAGIVVGHSGNSLQKQKDNIKLISMNLFVPVYFAFVGFKINLKSDFHLLLFVAFLLGSSLIKGLGVFCGTQMVKMPFKESLNFAFALNARGGPGIVLATLAFDAGLISAYFFTTLVITAIVTSLMAGSWLKRKVALEPTLEKI